MLKENYRKLESEVMDQIREKVKKSKTNSQYINDKAFSITKGDYKEIVIINDRLILLDEDGYHYSIYQLPLIGLINILEYDI